MEEYDLLSDSKYRSFISQIDKALKFFDYTTEWADLIAALGKLNKVLMAHMKYPIIPRRFIISKRLAQCMHPALPAGVHLKALETYDIIFKNMGTVRLAKELFLYSSGLFPLLGNAAITVRPTLLTIFETHFVPLGERLRPGLNGLLTGILPGLEEGSDHFERINTLLLLICDACGPCLFYGSLWECIASNHSIRLPGILFILNKFDRSKPVHIQKYLLGSDVDVLAHGLCQALQDSNVLVQRSTLELLIRIFPFHDPNLNESHLKCIITSSLTVLLRRDMSLNRRFFNWLLGCEDVGVCDDDVILNKDVGNFYFSHYTKQILIDSLTLFLRMSSDALIPELKPYKLLTTLFEKQEIGPLIVDELLMDVLRCLFHVHEKFQCYISDLETPCSRIELSLELVNGRKEDIIKTINLLLGCFDTNYIWKFCGHYFEKVCSSQFRVSDSHDSAVNMVGSHNTSILEICAIINFLMDVVSTETYIETYLEDLPDLFHRIVLSLSLHCQKLKSYEIIKSLSVCRKLLSRVHPFFVNSNEEHTSFTSSDQMDYSLRISKCISAFQQLYVILLNEVILSSKEHLDYLLSHIYSSHDTTIEERSKNLDKYLRGESEKNTISASIHPETLLINLSCLNLDVNDKFSDLEEALMASCFILVDLSSKQIPIVDDETTANEEFPQWLQYLILFSCFLPEEKSTFARDSINTLISIMPFQNSNIRPKMISLINPTSYEVIVNHTLISQIIGRKLWSFLGFQDSLKSIKCIELLYKLHQAMPHEDFMNKEILKSLHQDAHDSLYENLERYALFWHLSRNIEKHLILERTDTFDFGLLQLLNNLNLQTGPLKTQAQNWLIHIISNGDIHRVLEPLLSILLDPSTARISVLHAKLECMDNSSIFEKIGSYSNSKEIYKISSCLGDAVYHVTNKPVGSVKKFNFPLIICDTIKSLKIEEQFDLMTISKNSIDPFELASCDVTQVQHDAIKHTADNYLSLNDYESEGYDIVKNILEEILSDVSDTLYISSISCDFSSASCSIPNSITTSIHPLHSHLLLYTQVYDSQRMLYSFQCIKNMLITNRQLVVNAFSTSNLNNSYRCNQIQVLLTRHRKCVFGKNFTGAFDEEDLKAYQNVTFIELLISISLYFLRSYYPNLGHARLDRKEIHGNRNVQFISVEILVILFSELNILVQNSDMKYRTFINDLLNRFKVQKVVLHSLLAAVHGLNHTEQGEVHNFTNGVLNFNEVDSNPNVNSPNRHISNYNEAFHVQMLNLTYSLIVLEQSVMHIQKSSYEKKKVSSTFNYTSPQVLKYYSDINIPHQPIFLTAIIGVLRQPCVRQLHHHWTRLIISCLPFLGSSLAQISCEVITQIISNVEFLCKCVVEKKDIEGTLPPDYIINQLEALRVILHYCLDDKSSNTREKNSCSNKLESNDIVNNLLQAFHLHNETSFMNNIGKDSPALQNVNIHVSEARKKIICAFPRLVATISNIWEISNHQSVFSSIIPPHTLECIIKLLLPICLQHPISFITAISISWYENRTKPQDNKGHSFTLICNKKQKVLVDLVLSVNTMPISVIVQTVRDVIQSPPTILKDISKESFELSLLHFFYVYMEQSSNKSLLDCWSGLALLARDCLTLNPEPIFLSLSIINQFVMRVPAFHEKKDQKELQDIVGKLIDACVTIGGSCLEQTTWLRKNFVLSKDINFASSFQEDCELQKKNTQYNIKPQFQHASMAFNLLGDVLAPLLDVIYQSEEKEKVLPILQNVITYVMPYLRHHSTGNMIFFRACSRLLAGLSEYQYTRKAWRKEGFELLLDQTFFQMDVQSLQSWMIIVDSMMTHDNTTFRELMSKLASTTQVGSLNLFINKDMELEQKVMLVKRLAFVIFCSDVDQYYKQVPDIQERLADCLRTIPSSPQVQAAVFLCFRVLLLRLSQQHLTSLWPIIISEMVQIFSYMEYELSTDLAEMSVHIKSISNLETNWLVSAGANSLVAQNSPDYLNLYLSVCKLLDLTLALPVQKVPQFQMYRWAFVSEGGNSINIEDFKNQKDGIWNQLDFVPYVVRVAKLLILKNNLVKPIPLVMGQPQLTMTTITSINDLASFFASVCESVTKQHIKILQSVDNDKNDEYINNILMNDFLETFNPVI